jgi:hypothetical protein
MDSNRCIRSVLRSTKATRRSRPECCVSASSRASVSARCCHSSTQACAENAGPAQRFWVIGPLRIGGTARNGRCSHECFPHELAVGNVRGFDPNADLRCSSCSRWRWRTCGRRRPPDGTGFAYGNDALAGGWSVGRASGGRTAGWNAASPLSKRRAAFVCCVHRHVTCDGEQAPVHP